MPPLAQAQLGGVPTCPVGHGLGGALQLGGVPVCPAGHLGGGFAMHVHAAESRVSFCPQLSTRLESQTLSNRNHKKKTLTGNLDH